jgi:hypothetical protein
MNFNNLGYSGSSKIYVEIKAHKIFPFSDPKFGVAQGIGTIDIFASSLSKIQ